MTSFLYYCVLEVNSSFWFRCILQFTCLDSLHKSELVVMDAILLIICVTYAWHVQDEVLIEGPMFEEFWHRDVEESVRLGIAKPFIEEAVLQVSNWGFSLADLHVQRKCLRNGILLWLRSMYSQEECEWAGFLGPIHIWQVCEMWNLLSW